jgi:hypothetical protein
LQLTWLACSLVPHFIASFTVLPKVLGQERATGKRFIQRAVKLSVFRRRQRTCGCSRCLLVTLCANLIRPLANHANRREHRHTLPRTEPPENRTRIPNRATPKSPWRMLCLASLSRRASILRMNAQSLSVSRSLGSGPCAGPPVCRISAIPLVGCQSIIAVLGCVRGRWRPKDDRSLIGLLLLRCWQVN